MLASGSKIIEVENAQFNTMVCKGNMNFTRWEKKWRKPAGAASRHMPGLFWGEGPGQNRFNVPQRWPRSTGKSRDSGFANSALKPHQQPHHRGSLRGNRTDLDGVSVQSSRYRGGFSGLLVQRVQSRLVSGLQSVYLVAHDERVTGAMRHASAGALRGRLVFHMLSAAHGVAHFAGKGLLAASQRRIRE